MCVSVCVYLCVFKPDIHTVKLLDWFESVGRLLYGSSSLCTNTLPACHHQKQACVCVCVHSACSADSSGFEGCFACSNCASFTKWSCKLPWITASATYQRCKLEGTYWRYVDINTSQTSPRHTDDKKSHCVNWRTTAFLSFTEPNSFPTPKLLTFHP